MVARCTLEDFGTRISLGWASAHMGVEGKNIVGWSGRVPKTGNDMVPAGPRIPFTSHHFFEHNLQGGNSL
jgi:hypothetical protein